jgi:dCMP deaminase
MIKLDGEFKETYHKYYDKMAPYEVLQSIENDIKYGVSVLHLFNIVKTCDVLGQSYVDYYFESSKDPVAQLPDADKIIFNVVFYYIFNISPEMLEAFLDVRFKARNIYSELAYQCYGSDTPENIEKVKKIKTEHAGDIQLPNPTSRDRWFYDLAVTVGSYSKCHSRKIGAVLVKDNSVISTGYNGPPRGVPTCDQRWFIDERFKKKYGHALEIEHTDVECKTTKGVCPRRVIGFKSGEGLEICPAGHAERNALINAARLGIKTDKTKLYMSCGIPCTPCMVEIINAGVEEIVCCKVAAYDETGIYLLENSDLKVRIFDFLV